MIEEEFLYFDHLQANAIREFLDCNLEMHAKIHNLKYVLSHSGLR